MVDATELAHEQAYFDAAWENRERARHNAAEATGAGNRYDERALRAQNRDYVEQLADPDTEVAHGAIALDDGEVLYVGRNTIVDAERNRLVINWRTKVGELYERATPQNPLGVTRKRSFFTKRNEIISFEDVHFAELAEQIAELGASAIPTVDDALLADLDTGRTGAMRDIVRTIQASQSGLIRHDADALLLVQGGPGTGKSAVALHRASWLLFNEHGLRPERMLIVGPSDTFTHYIKDVLPGLGDAHIPQLSLRRLGPQNSSRREEPADTARLKGELRMAGLIERALHLRIRFAGDEPHLVIGSARPTTTIARDIVEAQLETLRHANTYNAGRSAMRAWLSDQVKQNQAEATRFGRAPEVDAQAVDAALDRLWPPLTPLQFLRDLLGSQARLQEAAGDAFTAGDIGRLYRQSAANLASEQWSDSDVALLDEADYRIRGIPQRYDHIVVDEAQDLSPMQIRSLRRRSNNGRYTIVGDIAQSTGPWARDTWDDVLAGLVKAAPVVHTQLDYGYRVPQEIYALAAQLLPLVAPGLEPLQVVRSAPEAPTFILDDGDDEVIDETIEAIQDHAIKGRFIGVVLPPGLKDQLASELASRGINFSDADKGTLGSSVNLISATEAKGLEFDAVVVVEPAAIAEIGDRGVRLLYIALTRATKYLTVVHARAFEPLGLEGAEPMPQAGRTYTEQLLLETRIDSELDFPSGVDGSSHEAARSMPFAQQPVASVVEQSLRGPVGATTTRRVVDPSAGHGTGRSEGAALSPMLMGAAKAMAEQIRDEVNPDKWKDLVAEIARQLDDAATD